MSLTSFVSLPDVAKRLAPFRPPVKSVASKVLVPRVSENPQLVGTAFDYLLRFELQRLAPHATTRQWVAEEVPGMISGPGSIEGTWFEMDFYFDKPPEEYVPPAEVAERIATVCRSARQALGEYLQKTNPTEEDQRVLAAWALRLGKIDSIFRGDGFDPRYEEVALEMVTELVDLLGVVPFEQFTQSDVLFLNPIFGEASKLVGGADADLIKGDMLLDFKTTKSCEVRGEWLDQLFGYFLLARRAGMAPITRVGFYFSRYAQIRVGQTACWTERADFVELEEWFFKQAGEVFPPPKPVVVGAKPKARRRKVK